MNILEGTMAGRIRVQIPDEQLAEAIESEADHIFSLARDILRDRVAAEDAAQDALEVAWRRRHQLSDPARIGAWLTTICVRRCLRLRTRIALNRARDAETLDGVIADAAPVSDPALAAAIGRLSPQQRAVVALHYGDGYTLDECASLLGCRPGTARQHVSRALARLRRELDSDT